MKNLQFSPYQCRAGRVGSKKSKSILILPCGAGLKSRAILAPSPLQNRKNPRGAKQGGAKLPSLEGNDILNNINLKTS